MRKYRYGHFLRIKRNCTTAEAYEKHSIELKKQYLLRGYPENLLENSRIKALEKKPAVYWPCQRLRWIDRNNQSSL